MSAERVGQEIRSQHPYAYRSGEWALIVGYNPNFIYDNMVRGCYQLRWPDGATDDWAHIDPIAKYEFRAAKEES